MFSTVLNYFAAAPGCEKKFLGLNTWYHYLKTNPPPDCSIKQFNVLPNGTPSDIPLVLLAVVDDLLRIAGLLAVMFVIYGGILYVTSQGNPDQTSKAQSTILNALGGFALSLIAIAFVSFIGSKVT